MSENGIIESDGDEDAADDCALMDQMPLIEEVTNGYQPEQEHIHAHNYRLELQLRKLKRCL